jgi:hypothetical protein
MVSMQRSYPLRDFPQADIHELISSDLFHQAIKGTFKDHLVEWVREYLEMMYEKAEAGHQEKDLWTQGGLGNLNFPKATLTL